MEDGGTDMVLRRATELRLKISNCIHKATSTSHTVRDDPSSGKENGVVFDGGSGSEIRVFDGEGDDDEEERLLNICDALESLETQLSSLQALQQQQRYEKEASLNEIEQSREMLLEKLKNYKGEHLEVINEASAFAGEAVEHNHDLMLPPYPSHPPYSRHSSNGHLPQTSSARRPVRNGVISNYTANEAKNEPIESSTIDKQAGGFRPFLAMAAKTMVTIVGVVSILSVSGFGQKFAKRRVPLKMFSFLQQSSDETERPRIVCPPGKFLVMEDGEARCLVKERIEVPFSSAVAKPDVNYGWG